jgi:gas vesicle protein
MEENNRSYAGSVGWFLVGGLTGACAALLLAPAAGKKTRERLARKLRNTGETVTDFTEEIADTTRQIADKAARIGDKAVRLASDASATARGVIGSLGQTAERATKRS